jgi:hypothetical protein
MGLDIARDLSQLGQDVDLKSTASTGIARNWSFSGIPYSGLSMKSSIEDVTTYWHPRR